MSATTMDNTAIGTATSEILGNLSLLPGLRANAPGIAGEFVAIVS